VWLNTPRRPQEASGTSGQKSPVNGGVNLSILDGWWAEGHRSDNGWAFGGGAIADPETQDKEDAAELYRLLEQEVVPLFFAKDTTDGLRHGWISRMKSSIASVVPNFSAHRMVRDYLQQIYVPAASKRG
jgi:alpha-glucan phosphorylase-like protein